MRAPTRYRRWSLEEKMEALMRGYGSGCSRQKKWWMQRSKIETKLVERHTVEADPAGWRRGKQENEAELEKWQSVECWFIAEASGHFHILKCAQAASQSISFELLLPLPTGCPRDSPSVSLFTTQPQKQIEEERKSVRQRKRLCTVVGDLEKETLVWVFGKEGMWPGEGEAGFRLHSSVTSSYALWHLSSSLSSLSLFPHSPLFLSLAPPLSS